MKEGLQLLKLVKHSSNSDHLSNLSMAFIGRLNTGKDFLFGKIKL